VTQVRFEQAMNEMLRDMQGTTGAAPPVMHFPVWFGVIFAVPLLSLLLWVVVYHIFLSVFVGVDLNDRWSCHPPANRAPPCKFP